MNLLSYKLELLHTKFMLDKCRRWKRSGLITEMQFEIVSGQVKEEFYSPNFLIRVLLFIASWIAVSSCSGLFAIMSDSEDFFAIVSLFLGTIILIVKEKVLIKQNNHFKSGITDAALYIGLSLILGSITYYIGDNIDDAEILVCLLYLLVLSITAIRYLDVLSLLGGFTALVMSVFLIFETMGNIGVAMLPFVFMVIFGGAVYWIRKTKRANGMWPWKKMFAIAETLSLLGLYLAGNYLVVREAHMDMLPYGVEKPDQIPMAFIFYAYTIAVPLIYLALGLRKKDKLLIRVALFVVALTVITFKYYYSSGHPEITLTLAGGIMLGIAFWALNYLKTEKHGYTREKILTDDWSKVNIEAFIIQQTMDGGPQIPEGNDVEFGGGEFGGGGAGGDF